MIDIAILVIAITAVTGVFLYLISDRDAPVKKYEEVDRKAIEDIIEANRRK